MSVIPLRRALMGTAALPGFAAVIQHEDPMRRIDRAVDEANRKATEDAAVRLANTLGIPLAQARAEVEEALFL